MRSVILFLLLTTPAWATWTLRADQSASCAGSVSTCNITVTNPTAGDLLVGIVMGPGVSITLSSFACGTDTFTNASSNAGGTVFTAAAYRLSATGGTGTTCTPVISANPGGTWRVLIQQWTPTSAPAVFDTQASRFQSTATTTPVAPTITLTSGANNLILETENATSVTAISGGCSGGTGYTVESFVGSRVEAYCRNSNDATAPTWTTANAASLLYALAFKETVAGGGASHVPHRGVVF